MSSAHVTGTRLHQPSIVTFNQKDELHFCRRRNVVVVVVVHGGKEKFFECMKNENVMMALALQYEQTTTNVCSNNGAEHRKLIESFIFIEKLYMRHACI